MLLLSHAGGEALARDKGSLFPPIVITPTISDINPTSGPVGSEVTINGFNFGASQGIGQVKFNGVSAGVISDANWNDQQIVVNVPAGATTGPIVVDFEGLASNGMNFTVTDEPPASPIPQTGLTALDTPNDTGGSITLTWTPSTSAGVTQQRIYRGTSSGVYSLIQTINNNTTNSFQDTGLANGTRFFYAMTTFNGATESAFSMEASAIPLINIFAVTIDARTLSASTFSIDGVPGTFNTTSIVALQLATGTHTLRAPAGGSANFDFTVSASGTVSYAAVFDGTVKGFLTGQGTSTLTIHGLPISLDARALTASTFDVTGVKTGMLTTAIQDLKVMPGAYSLDPTGAGANLINFIVSLPPGDCTANTQGNATPRCCGVITLDPGP
jgi:hypothetical protein